MQTVQALGAPKEGRPAFGDITNAAAAVRHAGPSEEEVSAHCKQQLHLTCHRQRHGRRTPAGSGLTIHDTYIPILHALRCSSKSIKERCELVDGLAAP